MTDTKKVGYISRTGTLSAAVPPPRGGGATGTEVASLSRRQGGACRTEGLAVRLVASNNFEPAFAHGAQKRQLDSDQPEEHCRQAVRPFERPQPAAEPGPSDTGSLSR
jgi:hypothetical protein